MQWSALSFAHNERHHGTVELLKQYGADTSLRDIVSGPLDLYIIIIIYTAVNFLD